MSSKSDDAEREPVTIIFPTTEAALAWLDEVDRDLEGWDDVREIGVAS